jgi:protease I
MANELQGKSIAILATDRVERKELEQPRWALRGAGARDGQPDQLRINADAMGFIRSFVASGKPIAAICHRPWTLIEADAVRGRRLTSWPSLRTDLRNAVPRWSTRRS